MIHVIDADDLREGCTGISALSKLAPCFGNGYERSQFGDDFKVTLFAIPSLCSKALLRDLSALPWVEIAAHGWEHATSRECQRWGYPQSRAYLRTIESEYGGWIVKGFKAPGWQISDGMYQALRERGWWVADQSYNNHRRPKGLKAYTLATEEGVAKHHFHLGHLGGHNSNELAETGEFLAELPADSEFRFVSEVVK